MWTPATVFFWFQICYTSFLPYVFQEWTQTFFIPFRFVGELHFFYLLSTKLINISLSVKHNTCLKCGHVLVFLSWPWINQLLPKVTTFYWCNFCLLLQTKVVSRLWGRTAFLGENSCHHLPSPFLRKTWSWTEAHQHQQLPRPSVKNSPFHHRYHPQPLPNTTSSSTKT